VILAVSLTALLALAPLRSGDAAPLVEVIDLEGRPVSLEPQGQVVIVDFFATWCPRCRESLADYGQLVATLGDRVRIVVVDVKEPPALTRSFFARSPLPAGVVLARDPRGAAMRNFGATAFPSYYVIDPSGTVRGGGTGWGRTSAAHLVTVVQRILGPGARGVRREGAKKGRPAPATSERSADERARRMGVEILH
jgi:thiol-disulfide isomerase/thioredoxin